MERDAKVHRVARLFRMSDWSFFHALITELTMVWGWWWWMGRQRTEREPSRVRKSGVL